jgi:hypothetical protein
MESLAKRSEVKATVQVHADAERKSSKERSIALSHALINVTEIHNIQFHTIRKFMKVFYNFNIGAPVKDMWCNRKSRFTARKIMNNTIVLEIRTKHKK